MIARRLGKWEPHNPEWHAARASRIGGSEIAAVCGWSPYETREQLLHRKAGLADPRPESKAMIRGQYAELAILAWVEGEKGHTIDHELDGTWIHPEHDWALANPDGITTDGVLIEAKSVTDRDASEAGGWGMLNRREGRSKIPLHYAAQVQWNCGVLGLDRWVVPVLHGATNGRPSLDFCLYEGLAEPRYFDFLLRKAEAFMADLSELINERNAA